MLDRILLSPPKFRFAVFAEYLRYRTLAGFLNDLVQVDESPAQVSSQNLSHSRFARAHETGQNQPGQPLCHLRIIERSQDGTSALVSTRKPQVPKNIAHERSAELQIPRLRSG